MNKGNRKRSDNHGSRATQIRLEKRDCILLPLTTVRRHPSRENRCRCWLVREKEKEKGAHGEEEEEEEKRMRGRMVWKRV